MSHRSAKAKRCLCRLPVALFGMLLVLTGPEAAAFEIFGLRLFERNSDQTEAEEQVIGTPQPYKVTFSVTDGTLAEDPEELETALKNASNLWADREEPASGAAGLVAKARGDYRRILDALYAQARYGGIISISIDGIEADELLPDAELANPAIVAVTINPGPLFTFSNARIVNEAPPTTARADRVADPGEEGFYIGAVAESGRIVRAGRLSVEAWQQQGHAKAEIAESRVIAAHDTDTIDATILLKPGRYALFGPVSVRGTQRMNPAFVARQTGLRPGEEYDPDDLEKASDRLTRLGVFRSARIEEAETIGADGYLPLQVTVQERLPRRFGIGGSYSTLDGFGLEAFWLHRNLFGQAEQLRIEGRVGGIGETIDPKELTYRLGTTFTKPGIYTPDTDFIASVYGDREVLENYTRTGITTEVGFTHTFTETLSARLFATGEYAEFVDDFGERDFLTAGLRGGLTYDTRDNPADATEGLYADLSLQPYYEFNYGNAAARVVAEARTYLSLDEESRFVLAGRAKIGALLDPPIAETPPDILFFAGGGGSVRGYAYRNIGVETTDGTTGGRSLIEGSAELRVRITRSIGLVGFVDAGYVGAEAFPDFSQDFRLGVGAGLRYLTAVGPIRLDLAVPLDAEPGDPNIAFYIGIGQAF